MSYSDSLEDLALYLIQKLTAAAPTSPWSVPDIYYGDQTNIPRVPALCVDTGEKRRELNGAPRRTMVTLICYIVIYHSKVQDMQSTRQQADHVAEQVEDLVHADPHLGDTVIHSLVTGVESGYLMRRGSLFRASRLTVEATVQTQLPPL